ncbi:hypothetical protein SAMN04489724_3881 [Algoriphagus locisalis]|uniref:Uncharacterized protein n=1 Tax=Algoriphagus locisalis TaxID=305507 RepID=A0A1I7DC94_9BACT|nr:hypothetical protein [Algoriphagus locisalis]SFU09225.1 hypothetical protein SAMN04489724_3881 [Algoriphagus locisalis]
MSRNHFKSTLALLLCAELISCNPKNESNNPVKLLDRIPTENTNQFYISNRAPLAPSALLKLPVGAVKPEGSQISFFHLKKYYR